MNGRRRGGSKCECGWMVFRDSRDADEIDSAGAYRNTFFFPVARTWRVVAVVEQVYDPATEQKDEMKIELNDPSC